MGICQFLVFLGLGLVSTADLPGPGPSDVPLRLHYANVEVIYIQGLDGRATFAKSDSLSPADCSIWDLHLHLPRELGRWCHHQGLPADVSSPQWDIFFSFDLMFMFGLFYIALGTLKSLGQAFKFTFYSAWTADGRYIAILLHCQPASTER
jgi:hypothetical protein